MQLPWPAHLLPRARRVVDATASATHVILGAIEEIQRAKNISLETYQRTVEAKMTLIVEACCFQDLTSQRILIVMEAMSKGLTARAEPGQSTTASKLPAALGRRGTLLEAWKTGVLRSVGVSGQGLAQSDIDAVFEPPPLARAR